MSTEKDPDAMTQDELNELYFQAIDGLMNSQAKTNESIKNIESSLKNAANSFAAHEQCISQLQEAVIELRQMMETMKAGSDSIHRMSSGGIILQ